MTNHATKPDATGLPSRGARTLTFATVVVASASTWTASAQASIAYAYLLASEFDFGGGCPACHTNEAGGLGTITKPFGKTMMKHGLVANDTESLYDAVVALSTSNDDSDGDTISDFDELSPDGNPNDPTVFPADAAPVPTAPAPTAPASTAPVPVVPPTTTAPTTTAPTTTAPTPQPTVATPSPGTTQPPAPSPSPAAASADGGGCSLAPGRASSNDSSLAAVLLAGLGLGFVSRRRRDA